MEHMIVHPISSDTQWKISKIINKKHNRTMWNS